MKILEITNVKFLKVYLNVLCRLSVGWNALILMDVLLWDTRTVCVIWEASTWFAMVQTQKCAISMTVIHFFSILKKDFILTILLFLLCFLADQLVSKQMCLLGKPSLKKKKCNIFYIRVWPPPYFAESVTKIQKKRIIKPLNCNIKPF